MCDQPLMSTSTEDGSQSCEISKLQKEAKEPSYSSSEEVDKDSTKQKVDTFLGALVRFTLKNGDEVSGTITDMTIPKEEDIQHQREGEDICAIVKLTLVSVNNGDIQDSMEIRSSNVARVCVMKSPAMTNCSSSSLRSAMSSPTSCVATSDCDAPTDSTPAPISDSDIPGVPTCPLHISDPVTPNSDSVATSNYDPVAPNPDSDAPTSSAVPSDAPSSLNPISDSTNAPISPVDPSQTATSGSSTPPCALTSATAALTSLGLTPVAHISGPSGTPTSPAHTTGTGSQRFPFSVKYSPLDEETKKNFWVSKAERPTDFEIFPVGHPKNTPIQNVWTASQHEVDYFDGGKYFVMTVRPENLVLTNDKHYRDTTQPHIVYCGRFCNDCLTPTPMGMLGNNRNPGENWIPVKAIHPQEKKEVLDAMAVRHGMKFWIRSSEIFGNSISQISLLLLGRNIYLRVLVLAGSNFQGAACVAAAKHLVMHNVDVHLFCLKNDTAQFEGTAREDQEIEGVTIIESLAGIKKMQFDLVISGIDDQSTPMTTLYRYREWFEGATVFLIDPPIISQSYSGLMQGMCSKNTDPVLVYPVRPAPCTFDEHSPIFVVNIPTVPRLNAIGSCNFNLVKLNNSRPKFAGSHSGPHAPSKRGSRWC